MNNRDGVSSPVMQRMYGRGAVCVCNRNGKAHLEQLFQEGAAKLRFPQSDRDYFQAVMINTAGGMTGGDRLEWEVTSRSDTTVTMTTQAAEKIYRTLGDETAQVNVRLSVEKKSRLCWLPQETILFDHSALQRRLEVDLADDAELLLSEAVIFGRKVMGEKVQRALFRDHWIIRRNKEIIHAEALQLGPDIGKDRMMPVFLNGSGAMAAVLLLSPDNERFLDKAREIVGPNGGVSCWDGKLLARIFEGDGYFLRKRLVALICLLNGTAGVPEVWSI